jgi:predicted ABC-type ATPase
MPDIFIIAGCNGAGKTTAAYNLLPEVFKTVEFVNADEIARGLSPFNPSGVAFQAGRIMLERVKQLVEEN